MSESFFDELRGYVKFGLPDEAALRGLHPLAAPAFQSIADAFYERILEHPPARAVLEHGERSVGHLKVTLVAWLDLLLSGPWDEAYFQTRCRIGRVHVRIGLPQHYMFGAMNVVRLRLTEIAFAASQDAATQRAAVEAVSKVLDLELAIMLHTYREDLLAQATRIERLATFGQLVGSIGHELRNPLGVMETSLYLLKGRLANDDRARRHAERIDEQIHVAGRIITSLTDLIRDRALERDDVALGQVVREAIAAQTPPDGVKVTVEVSDATTVRGDATTLRQVVVNLVENAIHAASPVGWVKVRLEEGPPVTLSVEDSGPGVDPAVSNRLFEPLVSTKARGLGLGLALVKRILDRHGATVSAEKGDVGARFVVRLPVN